MKYIQSRECQRWLEFLGNQHMWSHENPTDWISGSTRYRATKCRGGGANSLNQFYDDSTLSFAIRSNDSQLNKFHYTFKPHSKVGMIDRVQRKNQYYMNVGWMVVVSLLSWFDPEKSTIIRQLARDFHFKKINNSNKNLSHVCIPSSKTVPIMWCVCVDSKWQRTSGVNTFTLPASVLSISAVLFYAIFCVCAKLCWQIQK